MIYINSGVAALHGNNRTYYSNEGYIDDIAFWNLPSLAIYKETATDGYWHFRGMAPGLYRFSIDDKHYVVMLHHHYRDGNELIIKSPREVFGIVGVVKVPLTPYLVHQEIKRDEQGMVLENSVNGNLDLLVLNGKSTIEHYDANRPQSFFNPAIAYNATMIRVQVTDRNGISKNYLINPKYYLMSLDNVYDQLFMDCRCNKVTIKSSVNIIRLDGYENYRLIRDNADEDFFILRCPVPQMRAASRLLCSHFIITDLYSNNEGLVSSFNGGEVYIKLKRSSFTDIDAFRPALKKNLYSGWPVTIWYECITPSYKTFLLDEHSHINITQGKCWLNLALFNYETAITADKDSFVIKLTDDDIKPIQPNASLVAMFCYNHFKPWR